MKKQEINHIVVGLDLSEYSKVVVREAQKLAKTMNVPVTYVHVYDYELWPAHIEKSLIIDLKAQVLKMYKLKPADQVEIRFGDAARKVIEVAKALKQSPLIIVGHKGVGAVVRFFLGSTAEKIALLSPYPVWIHRGNKATLPKKVLIPSDFSKQTDKTLNQIKSFDRAFKPKLELFHVIPEPTPVLDYPSYSLVYQHIQASEDKTFAQFKKAHPDLYAVRDRGDVAERVKQRSKTFDLIAVSPRGKKQSRPLLGHVAAKLIRSSEKPVLVCP